MSTLRLLLVLSLAAACQSNPTDRRQVAIPPRLKASVDQPAPAKPKLATHLAGGFSQALVPLGALDSQLQPAFRLVSGGDFEAFVPDPTAAFTWRISRSSIRKLSLISIEDQDAVVHPLHGILMAEERLSTKVPDMAVTKAGLEVTYADGFHLLMKPVGRSMRIDVSQGRELGEGRTGIDMGGALTNAAVSSLRAIHVPYFDLASVAAINTRLGGVRFLSAWFDTEVSNASRIHAKVPGDTGSKGELFYSQVSNYATAPNGKRQPLRERIWITWAEDIEDCMPSMDRPASKGRELAGSQFFVSFSRHPFHVATAQLQELAGLGVKSLQLWIHHWQNGGYDVGYPNAVMPPNPNWGGSTGFSEMREVAAGAGFGFALHHNWLFNGVRLPGLDLLGTDGLVNRGYLGGYMLKSRAAAALVDEVEGEFHDAFETRGTFSDSLTAGLPYADFDVKEPGWGLIRTSLGHLTRVIDSLREIHGAPIAGEGSFGFGNVTWSGLVDAMTGSLFLQTNPSSFDRAGHSAQVVPHFALGRLHQISVRAGMGPPGRFFEPENNKPATPFSSQDRDTLQTLTALYGNAGYHWWFRLTEAGDCARDWWSGHALFTQLTQANRPLPSIRYVTRDGAAHDLATWIRIGKSLELGDVLVQLTWPSGEQLLCNLTDTTWETMLGQDRVAIAPFGFAAQVGGVSARIETTDTGTGTRQTLRSLNMRYVDGRGSLTSAFGITTDGAVGAKRFPNGWHIFPIPKYTLAMPVIGQLESVLCSTVQLSPKLIGPGPFELEWIDSRGVAISTEQRPGGDLQLTMADFTSRSATSIKVSASRD